MKDATMRARIKKIFFALVTPPIAIAALLVFTEITLRLIPEKYVVSYKIGALTLTKDLVDCNPPYCLRPQAPANSPTPAWSKIPSKPALGLAPPKNTAQAREVLRFPEIQWNPINANLRHEKHNGSEIVFDTHISTDSFGRRTTTGRPLSVPKKYLILAGCSHVFGHGVEDDETLASQLSPQLREFQIYNYGRNGSSPNTLWYNFKFFDLRKQIPQKSGVAVYYLFPFQLQRLFGSLQWAQHHDDMIFEMPWIEQDPKHKSKIVLKGSFRERKTRNLIYRLVSKSQILKSLGFDWPIYYTQEDLDLVSATLLSLKSEISKSLNLEEFYVVVGPGDSFGQSQDLVRALQRAQIKTIDFSGWNLWSLMDVRPTILGDGHPSPASNRFLAPHIAEALKTFELQRKSQN